MKHLDKLMMTSAVYQQSSEANPTALQADPQNRPCWRIAPRRRGAEVIRDALLTVSGSRDTTMSGPGTRDDNSGRRSVHRAVKTGFFTTAP